MDEERLGKAALICSLIGLIGLLILTEEREQKEVVSINLTQALEGKEITVQGKVNMVADLPSIFILSIENKNQEYKIVGFKDKDKIDLKKGETVLVQGEVKNYKGNLEIEARRITKESDGDIL